METNVSWTWVHNLADCLSDMSVLVIDVRMVHYEIQNNKHLHFTFQNVTAEQICGAKLK